MDYSQRRNGIIAQIIAALSSFITPFMLAAINVALPVMSKELSLDAVTLNWISTSYLLSSAVFLLPFGKIADIYGRKKVFLIGIIIFLISSVFAGFSQNSFQLISSRILQGFGSSMIFGTGVAILSSIFPPGERGRVIGLNIAAVYLGLTFGPFLGGLITGHLGWRFIFFFNIPLSLLVIFFIVTKLKGEWAEARGEKFDITGSVIYGVAIICIIYGMSVLPSLNGFILLGLGIIFLIIFIKVEQKITNPVLEISLFKNNRVFAFSNLAALINYSATFSATFLLSLFLQYGKSLSVQKTGLILLVQPVLMSIFSPLTGKISDKIQPRILASTGMALSMIGLLLLIFVSTGTSITYIIICQLFLGFGFALFSSPNTNAVMSSVEKKSLGIASATLSTMRLTGQMLSMGLATLVFAVIIGKTKISVSNLDAFVKSISILFIISSILSLFAIFASLARKSR